MTVLQLVAGVALVIFGATTISVLGPSVLFASFVGGALIGNGMVRLFRE